LPNILTVRYTIVGYVIEWPAVSWLGSKPDRLINTYLEKLYPPTPKLLISNLDNSSPEATATAVYLLIGSRFR
jgi:hypothetical protein